MGFSVSRTDFRAEDEPENWAQHRKVGLQAVEKDDARQDPEEYCVTRHKGAA
jgi:hypothetical protein